jgi:hypothetical protein
MNIMTFAEHILKILSHTEKLEMADFTKLNNDIAALSAKVDALLAKQSAPPVDEQPLVDAADSAVEAIAAKIPS